MIYIYIFLTSSSFDFTAIKYILANITPRLSFKGKQLHKEFTYSKNNQDFRFRGVCKN